MSYEQHLAAELRYRGLPEDTIAEVLAEVAAHTPPGEDPTEHFGTPSRYAEQYAAELSPGKPRTPRILGLALVLSLGYAAFAFLAEPLLNFDVTDYIGPIRLWPALVILGLGILASFLTATYRRAPTTSSH
ncbi:hypothetical protein [Arthrobacter flavus]|uniref:DUF1707 domain-containing protein n=1 Tax=Arthrobacter flavus TaxID=95172 RepID=A0ABW4Q590_9MICC